MCVPRSVNANARILCRPERSGKHVKVAVESIRLLVSQLIPAQARNPKFQKSLVTGDQAVRSISFVSSLHHGTTA